LDSRAAYRALELGIGSLGFADTLALATRVARGAVTPTRLAPGSIAREQMGRATRPRTRTAFDSLGFAATPGVGRAYAAGRVHAFAAGAWTYPLTPHPVIRVTFLVYAMFTDRNDQVIRDGSSVNGARPEGAIPRTGVLIQRRHKVQDADKPAK
jgi:hypothetical protein